MNLLTRILHNATAMLRRGEREQAVDYVIDAVQDLIATNLKVLDFALKSAELTGTDPDLVVVCITTLWYRRDDLEHLPEFYERVSRVLLVYDYHAQLDALATFRGLLAPSYN